MKNPAALLIGLLTAALTISSAAVSAPVRYIGDITLSNVSQSEKAPSFLVMARSSDPQAFDTFIRYFTLAGAKKKTLPGGYIYVHKTATLEWRKDVVNPANGSFFTLRLPLNPEELRSMNASVGIPSSPLFAEFSGELATLLYDAMVSSGVTPDLEAVDEQGKVVGFTFFLKNLKCAKTSSLASKTCTLQLR